MSLNQDFPALNVIKYGQSNALFNIFICTLVFSIFSKRVESDRVLTSPKVTDWGDWGPWEFCNNGQFATGMQLRTYPHQGVFRDDRGLTGIRLFCNKYGKKTDKHVIKSSVDTVGNWGQPHFCRGFMTGFQFRTEKPLSAFVDDTSTNNARMFCDHDETSFVEGDGTSFGSWTEKRVCARHEAVCGIRTQVELSSWDQTGLNNAMMKCCEVPHPIHNCVPKTSWELVATCEGSPRQDKDCKYLRKMGISYIDSYSDLRPLHEAVGYRLKNMITQFQSRFLNVSSDVSFEVATQDMKDSYWLLAPNYIWDLENTEKPKVTAKKGSKVSVYQIHGKCGMLEVLGSKMKKVETDTQTKNDVTTFVDFSSENELDYFA